MEVNIEYVKTLVPLDAWEGAISSVNCVTRSFGRTSDVHVTLLHIILRRPMTFGTTATFWIRKNMKTAGVQ